MYVKVKWIRQEENTPFYLRVTNSVCQTEHLSQTTQDLAREEGSSLLRDEDFP